MLFFLYLLFLLALATSATPSPNYGNFTGTAAPAYPGNLAVFEALAEAVSGPRTQVLVLQWANGSRVELNRLERHYGLVVGASSNLEMSASLVPGREPAHGDANGNFLFPRTWFRHWEPWRGHCPVPSSPEEAERLVGFRVPPNEDVILTMADESGSDARTRRVSVNPVALREMVTRMNYYTFTVRRLVEYFQLRARFHFSTSIPNLNMLSVPRPVELLLRDIADTQQRVWEWQGMIRWILEQAGPNWRNIPPRVLGMRNRWYSYLEREGVLDAPNRGTVVDWTNMGPENFPRIDWYLQRDVPVDWLWTSRSHLYPGLERLNPFELFTAISQAPIVESGVSSVAPLNSTPEGSSDPLPPPRAPSPSTESPRDRSTRWTEGVHRKKDFFSFWLFSKLNKELTPDDPEHPFRYGRVISWKKRRHLMDLELVVGFPRSSDCAWIDDRSVISRPMTPVTPDNSEDDEDGPFAMDTETSQVHGVTTGGGPAPPSPPGSPFAPPGPMQAPDASTLPDIEEERLDYGEPSEDEEEESKGKGKGKAREVETTEDVDMAPSPPAFDSPDERLAHDLQKAMERSLHEPAPELTEIATGYASSSRVRLPRGGDRWGRHESARRNGRDWQSERWDRQPTARRSRYAREAHLRTRWTPHGRSGGRERDMERERRPSERIIPTEPRADREVASLKESTTRAWGDQPLTEWGASPNPAWGSSEASVWGESSSVPTWGLNVSQECRTPDNSPESRTALEDRLTSDVISGEGVEGQLPHLHAPVGPLDKTREIMRSGSLLERLSLSDNILRRPLLDRVQDPPDVSSLSDLMAAVRLEMQQPSAPDERWDWTEFLARNADVQRVVRNRDRAGIIVEPGKPEQPVWNPPRAVPARRSFLYLGALSAIRAALVRQRYGPTFEEEFLLYAIASGVPLEYRVPLAELPPTPETLPRPAWFDRDPVAEWWNEHPGDLMASYLWAVKEVLSRPNAVRALQQGGLLWRIALEFGDRSLLEAAVTGPSEIATLHLRGDISDLPEPSITDSLSEEEQNALLGRVANGSSIWPSLEIFEGPSSVIWDGEWTFENERWFSRRRNQLVRGGDVLNRPNDWYRDVPRSGGIRKRSDGVGSLVWAERFSRAVAPLSRLYRLELDPEDFAPIEIEGGEDREVLENDDEVGRADGQRQDERMNDDELPPAA